MYASQVEDVPRPNGNRTSLESRVLHLESGQRCMLQGFEDVASQLKELGRRLADQLSATSLHGETDSSKSFRLLAQRLRELGDVFQEMPLASMSHSSANQFYQPPECKVGADSPHDDMFRNWDERLRTVENRVSEKLRILEDHVSDRMSEGLCTVEGRVSEHLRNVETGVSESLRTLEERALQAENKVIDMEVGIASVLQSASMKNNLPVDARIDNTAETALALYERKNNLFVNSMEAAQRDLRSRLDGKSNAIENARFPETLHNSYREFSSNQRNLHPLARTYNEQTKAAFVSDGSNRGVKPSFDEWREDTGKRESPWLPRAPSKPQSKLESPANFHRRLDQMTNAPSTHRWRSPERA